MSTDAANQPDDWATAPVRQRDAFAMFRAAFEGAPYGVVVADANGTILFANAVLTSILAYGPSELVNQPITCLVPESALPYAAWWTEFWKNPTGHAPESHRTLMGVRKDGVMVPLEVSVSVIAEPPSHYIALSVLDLTERVNLEARLASASNEHLGFQKLVADIAARLGTVEPERLDDTIKDVLEQLGETLRLDRVVLWHRPRGEAIGTATHAWQRQPHPLALEPFLIESIPYVISKLEGGDGAWFSDADELPDPIDRETFRHRREPRAGAVVPLPRLDGDDGDLRALALGSTVTPFTWSPALIERLRLIAGVLSQAIARTSSQAALHKALAEVRELRVRLGNENVELRREVKSFRPSSIVVAESQAIKRVIAQIEQVAPTPATVLLLGETGTGKEVMAQTIHSLSPRHQRHMVRVSCAAIPTALIESELFGRERGAYTGALSRQIGRFEAANQSTLFLDEIGELPAEVQVKLLRVLQERVIERLGSTQSVKVDVRIIAATNKNLEEAVEQKSFREDLYYRLNVFPIVVPPLRERVEDIPGLVWSFIDEFSRMFGKSIDSIPRETMAELQRYTWPGNVRELRNVIERAVIISTGHELMVPTPRPPTRLPQGAMTLNALEIEHIRSVLNSTNWRIRGRGGAAERLGLKPTTLESRMARLGITRKPST